MIKYKSFFVFITALFLLRTSHLYSQVDTAWVRRYNGPGNDWDAARAIALDGQRNVYVTGESYGSGTLNDYATIKYGSTGDTIWVRRYNGPGNGSDGPEAIVLDDSGNVYVTGGSSGSGTGNDWATIKYNSNGVEQWVARYNGPGNSDDMPSALAIDGQGNVYVTGGDHSSVTSDDYATIKYNSAGVEQWVKRYNGPGNSDDAARSIAVDSQGNVLVTGQSVGSGSDYDFATIKYNSNGDTVWIRSYNGPGNGVDGANAIVVDSVGNAYVAGFSGSNSTNSNYTTIKYNSAGVQQWVQRYNRTGNLWDIAKAIAVDDAGNVYVTGYSYGVGTNNDYVTIKYVQAQGIEENHSPLSDDRFSLKIFPNPAKTFFNVHCPLTANRIKIFDVMGKLIKVEELKGEKVQEARISLAGIKNGVYFVKVENEIVREKLVVTR